MLAYVLINVLKNIIINTRIFMSDDPAFFNAWESVMNDKTPVKLGEIFFQIFSFSTETFWSSRPDVQVMYEQFVFPCVRSIGNRA